MKTAIYINDGTLQFVLAPETEMDKKVLEELENAGDTLQTYRGNFWDCQGGYVRHTIPTSHGLGGHRNDLSGSCLIFRVNREMKRDKSV